MAWVTPKTDWASNYNESGEYIGDWFNALDFNRIKNNLAYLRDLAVQLYPQFQINDLGPDRDESQWPYADEINALEENLITINNNTVMRDYGSSPIYTPNGIIMDSAELNRLESAILDIYNLLQNQYNGRRMFTWKLGVPNDGFLHGM